jgi:hypothetical protein
MVRAAEMLERFYPDVLDCEYYLEHVDKDIQSIAVRSLGHSARERNVRTLLFYLERDETAQAARAGLRLLLNSHPQYMPQMIEAFRNSDGVLHNRLAEVLSSRIEYVLTKLLGYEHDFAAGVVNELITMGRVSELIEFLKRNRNKELEAKLVDIIRSRLSDSEVLARECSLFLPDHLLEKLGISRISAPAKKR